MGELKDLVFSTGSEAFSPSKVCNQLLFPCSSPIRKGRWSELQYFPHENEPNRNIREKRAHFSLMVRGLAINRWELFSQRSILPAHSRRNWNG